ncbi:MAG: hypothetical protein ABIJ91_00325 [Candidatus Kuenenbacteria bacterium]
MLERETGVINLTQEEFDILENIPRDNENGDPNVQNQIEKAQSLMSDRGIPLKNNAQLEVFVEGKRKILDIKSEDFGHSLRKSE